MLAIIKNVWLHFLVLGLLIYTVQQWYQPPQIDTITLPDDFKIAELRGQWLRSTGRVPSAAQMKMLIDNELDQQILYKEAIKREWLLTDTIVRQRLLRNMRFLDPDSKQSEEALFNKALDLGLHHNDLVVRRRLILRMEMLAWSSVSQLQPDMNLLRQRYAQQAPEQHPARIEFSHVFISRDRHQQPRKQAEILLEKLHKQSVIEGKKLSEPFLHGLDFSFLSEQQLQRYFGPQFTRQLFSVMDSSQLKREPNQQSLATNRWLGPISSSYGEHLVWISALQPTKDKTFAEEKKQLLLAWRREQEQSALEELKVQLRKGYRVVPAVSSPETAEDKTNA